MAEVKENSEKKKFEFMEYHETLTKDSKSVKSLVWKNFKRMLNFESNELVANFVICIHCNQFVLFHGNTTTQLQRHQRKCSSKPSNQDKNDKPRITFKLAELSDLRDAAAKFVIKDCRPFYAIEGDGLLDLCTEIGRLASRHPKITKQDYKKALPSRNTLTTHVTSLAEKANSIIGTALRDAIQNSGRFSVTTDLGTEQYNSTSLLSLTAHILREGEFGLYLDVFTIDVHNMQTISHTGENIRYALLQIFSQHGISEDEVKKHVVFVTDRGPNIRLAVSDFENEPCTAHLYNNVVGTMIDTDSMKTIISNATKLVRYVKVSHVGSQLEYRLKMYVSTRWNTAYDMLKSIYDSYREIEQLLEEKEASSRKSGIVDHITCLPITDLKCICDFLVFFKNMTTAFEGDKKVTLHRVWPALRELKRRLQSKAMDSDAVASMKDAGRLYIKEARNVKHFEPSMRHKLALFLHPEYRKLDFMTYFGKSVK